MARRIDGASMSMGVVSINFRRAGRSACRTVKPSRFCNLRELVVAGLMSPRLSARNIAGDEHPKVSFAIRQVSPSSKAF
jgi:hypothetical protein